MTNSLVKPQAHVPEMVERVARAICRKRLSENEWLSEAQRAEQLEAFWRSYLTDAESAIEAILFGAL